MIHEPFINKNVVHFVTSSYNYPAVKGYADLDELFADLKT